MGPPPPSEPFDQRLVDALVSATGSDPVTFARVHGGDVAVAWRVGLADGRDVFAKTHAAPPPGFFTTEAAGLTWLAEPEGAPPVPEVLGVGDDPAHLVLAWIDEGGRGGADEAAFGRALAALHRASAPCFGRVDGRTTGSLGLPNDPVDDWATFFAERRLLPLARIAQDRRALAPPTIDALEALAGRLHRLGVPDEPPARLHGDLWAGNRLVDRIGRSWLIDPAAHGGHREYDLAMMRLFGGFGAAVFAAYDEAHPLAPGWEDRIGLHQLAPLVVHAIKFGGSYVGAVEAVLARW